MTRVTTDFVRDLIDFAPTADQKSEGFAETQLEGTLVKAGTPFTVENEHGRWITIPYLIEVENKLIALDKRENTELEWATAEAIMGMPDDKFVEGLKKNLKSLWLLKQE